MYLCIFCEAISRLLLFALLLLFLLLRLLVGLGLLDDLRLLCGLVVRGEQVNVGRVGLGRGLGVL